MDRGDACSLRRAKPTLLLGHGMAVPGHSAPGTHPGPQDAAGPALAGEPRHGVGTVIQKTRLAPKGFESKVCHDAGAREQLPHLPARGASPKAAAHREPSLPSAEPDLIKPPGSASPPKVGTHQARGSQSRGPTGQPPARCQAPSPLLLGIELEGYLLIHGWPEQPGTARVS